MTELTLLIAIAPVYALGALCVWDAERSLSRAIVWPVVALYRTLGG